MAAALIIVAAFLAVARSQILAPWQSKNFFEEPNANSHFFADDASPAHVVPIRLQSIANSPAYSRIAQQTAAGLIKPQPSYVQYSTPYEAFPTAPSSFGLTKSQIKPASAQQPNAKWISVHGQTLASKNAIAVEVSPKNLQASRSPLFTAFPEAPRFNPQQSAATPTVAHVAILEDGTPVMVGLEAAQPLQTPQTLAVRYMTPQQVFAQSLDAQPSALFQEDDTPIQVVPAEAKTYQSVQSPAFAVFPQDASAKFINMLAVPDNRAPFYQQNTRQAPLWQLLSQHQHPLFS